MIRPTHIVHDLAGIEPDKFVADNPWIQAISYDRDGTVTDYHSPEVPEDHLEVLRAFAHLGIKQGFNSNSGSLDSAERLARVANAISDAIGDKFYYATSFEAGGRKPGSKTFNLFAEKTEVPVQQTVHIGDQWYKDVRGAVRAGLGGAVLVARYGEGDDWRVGYLQRPAIETPARIALRLPWYQDSFPAQIKAL